MNLPNSFEGGSGVSLGAAGKLSEVSVNSAAGASVSELTAPNAETHYPGIPHHQIGVATVGQVRAKGGDVVAAPTRKNPNHATLSGVTPEQASELFRPTIKNPSRAKK